jgi:hypothetical protein
MAQFPFKQSNILALAGKILAGLTDNPAVYPAPTVDLADFAAKIDSCTQARTELTKAVAVKEMATVEHQKEIASLKDMMRKQLRYAENVTGFNDNKLNMLGWAGKREKSSALPGQVRNLRAIEQGTDFVVLSWMSPADGGKAAAYQILRRDGQQSGTWINAGVSMATKVKLLNQPRHIDLEYLVAALNKTGAGQVSNTISVVL